MAKAIRTLNHPVQIVLSDLIRDPALAAIFRRAERDGLAATAKPPRHDGAGARCRVLDLV